MNLENYAKQILNKIKEYDRIMVFRHESPDFDALGTQFGLVNYLKHNFKDKEILAPGFSNVPLAPLLYPVNDEVTETMFTEKKFLAIVCDTGNAARISEQNFMKADFIIKIDHHPAVEQYGNINVVDDSAGSCSELVCSLLATKAFKKYSHNKESAKFFYSGIVGDTGRFQFPSTSPNTLRVAADLLEYGFKITDEVYYPMYVKDMNDFERTKEVMNNYKITKKGVAYYLLKTEQLKKLKLDADEAKVYLSLFSMHEGIKVWCCFVQDDRKNNYRGSIRSRNVDINEVCAHHNGGGHKQAAGCRFDTLAEMKDIIKELEDAIEEQGK